MDSRCLDEYLSGRWLSIGVWGTNLGAIVLNTLMVVDGRYGIGVSIDKSLKSPGKYGTSERI